MKIEFFTTNGEMYALAPKSYHTVCNNTGVTKEGKKGIPKWFDLRKTDFHSVLYNQNPANHCVEVKSLRLNKHKQMKRTVTKRKGLTDVHVKLAVLSDKITCVPITFEGKYI